MKIIGKKNNEIVARLEAGEEFIGALKQIAVKRKIRGAWFWAIGACDDVTLAFYDLEKKKYISRRFRGRIEILNITGNIARKGKEIIIHAHGTFGGSPRNAGRGSPTIVGGHIMRCVISATCEIYLEKFPPLKRAPDSRIGLNLLTS